MKVHDKYVIELKEVIKGYGNDPTSHGLLPCDYKFYEIDGVAICEESFKKMTPLNDLVIKALEELCDEIDNESADGYLEDCHGYIIGSMLTKEHIIEIINRKMAEISGKDCRDCKKWNDCECGKKGHDNGTSIGYSAGECSEYEEKGDKE